jgi:hypothetical protein
VLRASHPTHEDLRGLHSLKLTELRDRLKKLTGGTGKAAVDNRLPQALREAIHDKLQDKRLATQDVDATKDILAETHARLPSVHIFRIDGSADDEEPDVQEPLRRAIDEALESVSDEFNVIKEKVQKKAEEKATRIVEKLRQIDQTLADSLVPDFKAEPKMGNIFKLTLKDERGVHINRRGSGVRRMFLFAAFLAEIEHRKSESQADGTPRVYAIEEPETALHPTKVRAFFETLKEISREENCQIVVTSHTPEIANCVPISSLRHIRKSEDGTPEVRRLEDDPELIDEIVRDLGTYPPAVDHVRVVVCLEGPTDILIFREAARKFRQIDESLLDLENDPRVLMIPLGGSTLEHWVTHRYLRQLKVPEIHVYDHDNDPTKHAKSIEAINLRGDGSVAMLTRKREIENYVHEAALVRTMSFSFPVDDTTDIEREMKLGLGKIVGQTQNANKMVKRYQGRRPKDWIAEVVFPAMTLAEINERDTEGEFLSWFKLIRDIVCASNA